jgi:hypothetical protein
MSKFKIGDRVVVSYERLRSVYDEVYTVIEIGTSYIRTDTHGSFLEKDLELECVANSPLREALTEEKLSNPKTKSSK